MASFLVESYVPGGDLTRFAVDVNGLRLASARPGPGDRLVRHVRSYLVPGDEMGYHVMEAPDADAVVRLAELARVDVERVIATIGIGPEQDGPG